MHNHPHEYVRRNKSGFYEYYRRVPSEVAPRIKAKFVKKSLKTKDIREALERAEAVHKSTEHLWAAVASGNDNATAYEQHKAAVGAAQSLGFTYRPVHEVAALPWPEYGRRLRIVGNSNSETINRAVTGTAPEPRPVISDVWKLYEEHNASGLTGMSKRQLAKHKVSRERAVAYTREVMGNVRLADITRRDVLRFRDWWVEKISKGGLKAYSANRSFSDMKGMLTVIDDALQTNFREPWSGVRLKETNATKLKKRLPFPVEWVRDRILAPGALDNLNEDARLIVYTMVETGMRLGEVCNLRPQDIHLDGDVPCVEVADRTDRRQKTDYSIRRIPLVGVSLWAMRQRSGGFPRYHDKADSASAIINKILTTNKLRPTNRHTAYSLRHTFQDRIENAGASDRMQADLMGHEFGRPTYGDGAEMKRRREFLESIKFDWPDSHCGTPATHP